MVLAPEDRDYLTDIILSRFESILTTSRDRVFHDVVGVEAEIARKLGPILSSVSLQDARGLNRRLQGFQDEVRVLKLLLEERVYGQFRARARGQVASGAKAALGQIEETADQTRWRALVRGLLPDVREGFSDEIEQWYATFFATAARFCDRVGHDLALLELEARHRYDVAPLVDLFGEEASLHTEEAE